MEASCSSHAVALLRGLWGALAHALAAPVPAAWHERIDWLDRWTTVEATAPAAGVASYRFRAGAPGEAARERIVAESPQRPRLRTGNPLFDGLFALAVAESVEDSVTQITDAQFNGGQPIPCQCFETGAKWHYVWTRDISYAVDLGLAYLDPLRALNSLRFKRSGLRGEQPAAGRDRPLLVAQDTGSGGSWPVSSDRVVWIHAAMGVLGALPPVDAARFKPELRQIAVDTLDQDREYVFDARAGLYRGETSFLDWRDQSYPAFTRDDTRYLAGSFALSTNILHYVALRDAATLERRAGGARSGEFDREASELRRRIDERFWEFRSGLYASYLGPDLAPAAIHDLLGLSLAVIHGIADERRARAVLAHYPASDAGPSVIWPEQPGIAIYHNRAVWPFATAYGLAAARRAHDPARMTAFAESLIRGAALALSNMENFEFLTQQTTFDDGPLTGPVINSPRQLWSVAGYVGAVVSGLFGVSATLDGVEIAPVLPGALATRLVAPGAEIVLEQLTLRGSVLNVRLRLPQHWSDDELLEASAVTVNGAPQPGSRLGAPAVAAGGVLDVVVDLIAQPAHPLKAPVLAAVDPHTPTATERSVMFAPPAPALASAWRAGTTVQLKVTGVAPGGRWHLYRDGAWRASGVADQLYREHLADPHHTVCYAATAAAATGGLRSLPSAEMCREGADSRRSFTAASGALASPDGHALATVGAEQLYADWGEPQQRLTLSYVPRVSGL